MRKILSVFAILLIFSSCAPMVVVDSRPKNAPPGKVKKATGSQSAKPHAPGQQKKKL